MRGLCRWVCAVCVKSRSAPLFEKEWNLCCAAAIADVDYPLLLHRPRSGARLASNNNPVNAIEGQILQGAEQGFEREEFNGGRYRLTVPNGEMPQSRMRVEVKNAYRPEDEFVIGLPWSGTVPVRAKQDFCTSALSWYGHAQRVQNNFTRDLNVNGTSIQIVVADTSGRTIFQDVANNTVYVKVKGGLNTPPWCQFTGNDDFSIARPNYIVLQPASMAW